MSVPADEITPDILLRAYAMGIFPMSDGRDDTEIHWIDPRRRGILPLDGLRISRSLAKRIRSGRFSVTVDHDFEAVLEACAARDETWISRRIQRLYADLHRLGFAHSVEVWQGEALVGGVYGVTLGAAFFGESMFSRAPDASKVALAFTVHRLRAGGFALFDTQFLTPHLASLGAVEITRADYHRRLTEALALAADFAPEGYSASPSAVAASSAVASSSGSISGTASPGRIQPSTQTS